MAKIDTKNLVLHGVGEAFLLSGDGKVSAKLGSLQDMTIEVTATMEDVFITTLKKSLPASNLKMPVSI